MIENSKVSASDKEFGMMAEGAIAYLRGCGQTNTKEVLEYLTPKLKDMSSESLKGIYDIIMCAYESGKCGVCRYAEDWDKFKHEVEVALCSRQCVNTSMCHCVGERRYG